MATGSCPKSTTQRVWWQVSLEGHTTCTGGAVSVVHMLLLTQEGNTNFDFHDLFGGIALSIAVTGQELLL